MNNKGFSLSTMLFFCIFVVLVILLFNGIMGSFLSSNSYGKNYKNVYRKYLNSSAIVVPSPNNNLNTYEDLEIELATALKKYVELSNTEIKENQPVYITLDTLKNSNLISDLKDIKNPAVYCKGYAQGINTKNTYIYKGYVSCGNNYKTSNFNENYAN